MEIQRMKPEIKALWVDALRSGEYQQGQNKLHVWDEEGTEFFCCLGVLCDLAVNNGVKVTVVDIDDDGMYCYENEVEFLPQEVMEWSGVWSKDGEYEFEGNPDAFGKNLRGKLTNMNDAGVPFFDIADEIEKWL